MQAAVTQPVVKNYLKHSTAENWLVYELQVVHIQASSRTESMHVIKASHLRLKEKISTPESNIQRKLQLFEHVCRLQNEWQSKKNIFFGITNGNEVGWSTDDRLEQSTQELRESAQDGTKWLKKLQTSTQPNVCDDVNDNDDELLVRPRQMNYTVRYYINVAVCVEPVTMLDSTIHRSASDKPCLLPRTHNTFGDRSVCVAGPHYTCATVFLNV